MLLKYIILFSQECKHLSELELLPNKTVRDCAQSKGSTINAKPKCGKNLGRDNKKLTLHIVN